MNGDGKHMRLREWLIAQIDGGNYAGLSWENQEKTMFRIPWKHAAKQDYKQDADAALFKAWAVYKGKYREGRDKADPSTWKTRLRCALNKSTDFREVPQRSQLDISEPYKVYHIQAEGGSAMVSPGPHVIYLGSQPDTPLSVPANLPPQLSFRVDQKERMDTSRQALHTISLGTQGQSAPTNCEDSLKPIAYRMSGSLSTDCFLPATHISGSRITDFRLQVRLYYQGQLVQDVTTSSADGCWILQGSVPVENERIYGPCTADQVCFPPPKLARVPLGIAQAMARLLPHLERGVLLWVAPDGVFTKRFCQGRVYWGGPLAQHQDKPNKLEREKTCKLLDMPIFLKELQQYLHGGGPKPRFEIDLCFGEEFPVSNQNKAQKLITAQVEPLFARNMLLNIKKSEKEEDSALGGQVWDSGRPTEPTTACASTADLPFSQRTSPLMETGGGTELERERSEVGRDGKRGL
ncbi:hypothetical protein COCON_G00143960 [Conger conger]|uniref:IRF tryptophan pentad repeat domain-containing protein n=1 Tax=Conger conger TaxID=82655 RepID=A0A9Q1DB62_CONCO|nr:interferon regulatory factor 10 [Conger conger]KAJ8265297.1 hypothetical protein COCON_G00143960 [Conger conger]